jgi:hypothetical protein
MSSTKSVLVLLGLGVLGANVALGCSSTTGAGFDDIDDSGPGAALPETGSPTQKADSSVPSADDASLGEDSSTPPIYTDAGSDGDANKGTDGASLLADAEAGSPDASQPDAGAEGSPCPTNNQVGTQSCGLCGYQSRLCAPRDPADPASPLVWQEWGFCQNEVAGGCVPGTSTSESCGLCGTRQKICQVDCQFAVGACKNEPPNACQPGKVEYQAGLSCDEGGRSRTCGPTCQYGSFGACYTPGAPTLTVSATVGGKVSGEFNLSLDNKQPRLGGTCPNGSLSSTSTAYQYVVVQNTTANTIVASIYTNQSTNAGSGYIDTVIASYNGSTVPATDVARKACVKGVNDGCSDPAADACESSWGGLVGANAVTIGPNAKVLVYVAAWGASDKGDYQLIARTESVTP